MNDTVANPQPAAPGFSVPVIDLSPYMSGGELTARRATATALDRACREVGFMQVVGHGIAPAVTDALAAAMDLFFNDSTQNKRRYQAPAAVNRGYSPPAAESLSLSVGIESASKLNDFFEAFNIGTEVGDYPGSELLESDYPPNIWPAGLPEFRESVQAYFAAAGRVARTLTRIFADALDLPSDFFAGFTDHSVDVLRLNNYALEPGTVDLDDDLSGMGEHTDFGVVTVLWAEDVPGLQVLGPDRRWHDVSPAPGALLVNLGDLAARWTNERWLSTLHRVRPPIVEGAVARRRSAAYFHDGNIDAVISAIATCVPAGQRPTYPPTTVGEHLRAKLAGSRGGKLNTAATREMARVRAAD